MGELADVTRHTWFDLWNHRAIDEQLELIDPAYVQVDHRALSDSGQTRDEWETLTRTWWEIAPDVAAVEFEVLGEEGEWIAYYLLFAGHDSVSGGRVEMAFYIVNRVSAGRFLSADMFDDREAALTCFSERSGRSVGT